MRLNSFSFPTNCSPSFRRAINDPVSKEPRWCEVIESPIYIVTDVELNGLVPGRHSMLSFGSVAVRPDGHRCGEFEAVLDTLDNATVDPNVMAFWQTQPEAYAAATRNPEAPTAVMGRFVDWVRQMPGDAIFAAHPLALDGPWIDFYMRTFASECLFEGSWRPNRLFKSAPLCLASFAAGRLGWPSWTCDVDQYPADWLGDHEHTHRAIDDARGYAHLLVTLMREISPA
ncbi:MULTISPECIES: exonuclease domain-containing protein [Azospirillum]|uniref:DNA polymerase III subunit epsilon n=1 Tax=Azospirillum lipoferum TaxID=193 RepID=A0A5A9FZ10_AZOLI|nr:exonuclease domain-containing protein [Azospirillum lipoferum]KAA0587573.1 DNA polymerase III subunit epsilon [Azospirillum lipoferum]